jgi:hypothetical protein
VAEPEESVEAPEESTWSKVKELFKNKVYLGMVGALSGLYFVITGI